MGRGGDGAGGDVETGGEVGGGEDGGGVEVRDEGGGVVATGGEVVGGGEDGGAAGGVDTDGGVDPGGEVGGVSVSPYPPGCSPYPDSSPYPGSAYPEGSPADGALAVTSWEAVARGRGGLWPGAPAAGSTVEPRMAAERVRPAATVTQVCAPALTRGVRSSYIGARTLRARESALMARRGMLSFHPANTMQVRCIHAARHPDGSATAAGASETRDGPGPRWAGPCAPRRCGAQAMHVCTTAELLPVPRS